MITVSLAKSCEGYEVRWLDNTLQGWYPSRTKASKALDVLLAAQPSGDGFDIRCYKCEPEEKK